MTKFFSSLLLVVGFSAGCTHLASVSTTSIPKARGKKVQVETDRFIFLLMNFNNDYVDELATQLADKCVGGKVQGILTKHESIVYFPLIAHKVRVSAEGYCVAGKRSKKRARR